jgi:hypothetical protein
MGPAHAGAVSPQVPDCPGVIATTREKKTADRMGLDGIAASGVQFDSRG